MADTWGWDHVDVRHDRGMTHMRGDSPVSDLCAEAIRAMICAYRASVGVLVQSAHPEVDQEKAKGRAIVSQGLVSLPYSTVWGWKRKLEAYRSEIVQL
ncbi:uncharacterized protein N7498_006636 [Penicillium cinerascens]|uniref:Uncharacterized protein n=1 Tax=Penicillium cinerascens TaxID=70096 RepID=A0A9W9MIM3_9EURO|nr:uncharacterized protein N7498_006636 [Penicillium cinerascens]KAJ5201973.1 hypothetical protein N7498_006636 [Penicillium cinerascens]